MKKVLLILILGFLCSQSGCTIGKKPPLDITLENLSNIQTNTPIIINSADLSTNTPQIEPTKETEVNKCFPMVDFWIEQSHYDKLPGMLILQSGSLPFTFTAKQSDILNLPEHSSNYSISPNIEKFSYIIRETESPTGKWLVVMDIFGGKDKIALPERLDAEWAYSYWLDNERLAFNIYINAVGGTVFPVATFNPSTGEMNELPINFPNLEPSNQGVRKLFLESDMVFDPSLRYVAYLETLENGNKNFVLWDRELEAVVASVPTKWNFLNKPIWNSGGDKVYFPVTDFDKKTQQEYSELFQIETNGTITKLTYFEGLAKKPLIAVASLSPDGRKIAYWWQYHQGYDFSSYALSVLDLDTLDIVNLCINPTSKEPTDPIWSPDSNYLAIWNITKSPGPNDSELLIINLEEEWQGILFTNTRILGWLKAPE